MTYQPLPPSKVTQCLYLFSEKEVAKLQKEKEALLKAKESLSLELTDLRSSINFHLESGCTVMAGSISDKSKDQGQLMDALSSTVDSSVL